MQTHRTPHLTQRGDQALKTILMTNPTRNSMAIFASTSTEKLIFASLQFDYRYCHIDHLIDSHFDYS